MLLRKMTLVAALSIGTIVTAVPTAQAACGIDCWLRNTFSTNDFVGDWLKDTFGPIRDGGTNDGRLKEALARSDKIASQWKPGRKIIDEKTAATAKPSCKLPQLLNVVVKSRSPEATLKNCF